MHRILVVEDETGIAMVLEDDLRAEGFAVEVVADGQAAIERATTSTFDLILLDVMLPRKDGFAVCRELRALGIGTPIILLTARTLDTDKILGLDIGADDYVTKPYNPGELRARLKAVLRRTAAPAPERFTFGSIVVDFARREVLRDGAVVPMTPLEFRLLAVFVKHCGRALSRQRLIDEAWGRDVFVSDRVVDNQVTNLRKKVEHDASQPTHIQSVRGFGYRFDAGGTVTKP